MDIGTDTRCPISGEPIEPPDRMQLPCGHTFDIHRLYAEVRRQKLRPAATERPRLRLNEMKCPYCRTVFPRLLPPALGQATARGVNSPRRYCLLNRTCIHTFSTGARKGTPCGKACFADHCTQHARTAKALRNRGQCEAVLSRGPRKDSRCGSLTAPGAPRCKAHTSA
jgi:hypothetical protein